jgi:DnaJ-class molecular chaperone
MKFAKPEDICKRCGGEGCWFDFGRKDVVECPDCKGDGVKQKEKGK